MGAYVSPPMYQREISRRYRLVARKCQACDRLHLPPQGACPHCLSSFEFEDVELSGQGRILTFTRISAGGAPPEFSTRARLRGDYSVAIVQLEEGPCVIAQLTGCEEPVIGLPVEATLRKIYTDEGVIRYGYKFRPA